MGESSFPMSCTLTSRGWRALCTRVDDGGKTSSGPTCWQCSKFVVRYFGDGRSQERTNSFVVDLSYWRSHRERLRCCEAREKDQKTNSPFMLHRTPLYDKTVPEVPARITDLPSNQLPQSKHASHEGRFQWLANPQKSAVSPGHCSEAHDFSTLSLAYRKIADSGERSLQSLAE